MVHKIIRWAVDNPLVVVLLTAVLAIVGGYAFWHVNVEAYPDPAPAIIEVIAKFPGASAEEVERQVTIPLEVALAGMPGLKYTRSKSLFGLSHLRNQFDYGIDYNQAKQDVINRLQFVEGLPDGVQPTLSPQSPTGEILRYTLRSAKDAQGNDVYTLNDLKSTQDWVLERAYKRVPRIIDVVSSGGTVKRYEIQPDPYRLMRYGITLDQLQKAIADSNANIGGDYLITGENLVNVRGIGLIGEGLDPLRASEVISAKSPEAAAAYLRAEEIRRVQNIRSIVIKSVDNVPIRVEDVVEGGPLRYADEIGKQGVVVSNQPRLGKVSLSQPKRDAEGHELLDAKGHRLWQREEEKVQGIVLLRKGEASLPALAGVEQRTAELNDPSSGRLPPGVKVEPYYDRTELINVTTETVHENLFLGMVLVTIILLMFLSNVRSALIVAINIPLALAFAFAVLFLRGKSANLLSIGAVDFGIIVDSSVIMVENIYRHLSSGEHRDLTLRERILSATREVEKSLFFTTAIMVCAFLPLFTMQGPEGQIFGPMADTYAFALGGALLLALTIAPVLCLLMFKTLRPAPDNFLVRWLKTSYLRRLAWCLEHRTATMLVMSGLLAMTIAMLPLLGREFMPELEEGNLWVRATMPISISPTLSSKQADMAQDVLEKFPEARLIVAQNGRPDDGTDPTGFYNVEFFIPLKPHDEWPATVERTGLGSLLGHLGFGSKRARSKQELIEAMNDALTQTIVGVNWNFSQNIRDNVMESLSGVKGDNSVKIIGPDLAELERLAEALKNVLTKIDGIQNVGVFRVQGQPNLELPVDSAKCSRWGVSVANINDVIQTAVGGKPVSQMVEGERRFDITLRWPAALRSSENAILEIPVDLSNNTTSGDSTQVSATRTTGAEMGLSSTGTQLPMPSYTGSQFGGTFNNLDLAPRRRLRDLVSPPAADGAGSTEGQFVRPGASTIYREQGNRLIAVKFSVRGRDLAGAVAEAQAKSASLFKPPYRTEWSGEFQEMQEAEHRLLYIVPISLTLIYVLLYLAFHSFLDAILVFSNVVALSMGGVWALLLTGMNFSISAAVGFISIFGVAVMDGLLLISYFNQLRAHGVPLKEAIMQGAEKRVRPVMMTALTAIFGLLPAAFSTKIGAQTQQPLAIVVVGGMISTLALTRYLMPVLYSFYGHRDPPAGSDSMAH
ncbi:MAG TPA: efflux RND transporter permease subunit [Pirellulales bacterium]|jgi:cobalt-zinc-cadmium resistance protein CzcA|nr:efflux RND transporter permease subunit [Pirellulales bacterium]